MSYLFHFLLISCSVFSCASQKAAVQPSEIKTDSTIVIDYSKDPIADDIKGVPETKQTTNKAFFTVTAAGTQMINVDGQAVTNFTINRFLYLEFPDEAQPKITSLYYGSRKYNAQLEKISTNVITVGKMFLNGNSVSLRPIKGYSFWKITASPSDGKEDSKTALKNIRVKGTIQNKPFTIQIPLETELQGEMRY